MFEFEKIKIYHYMAWKNRGLFLQKIEVFFLKKLEVFFFANRPLQGFNPLTKVYWKIRGDHKPKPKWPYQPKVVKHSSAKSRVMASFSENSCRNRRGRVSGGPCSKISRTRASKPTERKRSRERTRVTERHSLPLRRSFMLWPEDSLWPTHTCDFAIVGTLSPKEKHQKSCKMRAWSHHVNKILGSKSWKHTMQIMQSK